MAMAVTYETFDGVLLSENRGGTVTEYFGDPLRSLVRTEDSTGAVTSTATYWPYGELRVSTGSNPSPWGFVGLFGYFTDSVSRLYVRMRHYRPDTTAWMTVDQLWPGEHAYRFVKSNPTLHTDYWGLQEATIIGTACCPGPGTVVGLAVDLGLVILIACLGTQYVVTATQPVEVRKPQKDYIDWDHPYYPPLPIHGRPKGKGNCPALPPCFDEVTLDSTGTHVGDYIGSGFGRCDGPHTHIVRHAKVGPSCMCMPTERIEGQCLGVFTAMIPF